MTTTNALGIAQFCDTLQRHAVHKAAFYDGINTQRDAYSTLALITEEAGEVASALIRGREYCAVAECIDLAHTTMLLATQLDPEGAILKTLKQSQRAAATGRREAT